jgi:hypothetical protein
MLRGYRPIIFRLFCGAAARQPRYSTLPIPPVLIPASAADDFLWFPRFFDAMEQHALLSAALRKLDATEPRASRKRRRNFLAAHRQDQPREHTRVLECAFLPDEWYHFEEVRPWRLRSTA